MKSKNGPSFILRRAERKSPRFRVVFLLSEKDDEIRMGRGRGMGVSRGRSIEAKGFQSACAGMTTYVRLYIYNFIQVCLF